MSDPWPDKGSHSHAKRSPPDRLKRHRVHAGGFVLWVVCAALPTAGRAEAVASCGGFAMLGGAQINCSHVQPTAPDQFCTFSWVLMTTANTLSTIQGSFLLPRGANNMTVYQGSGFNSALSNPIVLCQGKKSR